jgi:hypothetical protein
LAFAIMLHACHAAQATDVATEAVRLIYEAIGPLVRHAGEALTSRHSGAGPKDVRTDREFRQIATLLSRIGSIWPHLFDALDRENRVFVATLEEVRAACAAHGVELPPPAVTSLDPLIRYREALAELDVAVQALQGHRGAPWADAAVRRLRAGLAEAAEIQGELIDQALSV